MQVGATSAATTADLRRRNLLLLTEALRVGSSMSRLELAEATGVSVASVHRLTSELIDAGWLEQADPDPVTPTRQGRPATRLRFRDELAAIVGVDVGSETTRISVASLSGVQERVVEVATADLKDDPGAHLARAIRRLPGGLATPGRPLAAVAVGVPSIVDGDGVLVRPWRKEAWTALPLRAQLSRRLGCVVDVAQDNHFSALAEASPGGSAPGARAVLVVELGIGIGAGLALDGRLVTGAHGGVGRLMAWPCSPPRGGGELGSSLGELLTAEGLVLQYRWRGGSRDVSGGADLLEAAARRDSVAATVVRWAGRQLTEVLQRLAMMLDPDVIVLGGGLGRGLHHAGSLLEGMASPSGLPLEVRSSTLANDAVVTGALLTARARVPDWIENRVER